MADNVTVDNGAQPDYDVATDERTIGGVLKHVQRVAPHGTPNLTPAQVEVTNSSTTIIAADSTRQDVTIVNRQTVAVWINDGTATTSHFRLDAGDSITLHTGAAISGITSAPYTAVGDAKVHVIATHD